MHISEQVAAVLTQMGFVLKDGIYSKLIEGFAEAGQLSNGARVVRIRMDESGRWLERIDGWHKVEKDVDLRNYPNQPLKAISDVLSPKG